VCSRKAALATTTKGSRATSEFDRISERVAARLRKEFRQRMLSSGLKVKRYAYDRLSSSETAFSGVTVQHGDMKAACDFIIPDKIKGSASIRWTPATIVGGRCLEKRDRIELALCRHVLSLEGTEVSKWGLLVSADKEHRVNLESAEAELMTVLEQTKGVLSAEVAPNVRLNSHCPFCAFRNECYELTRSSNDISLMRRLSDKAVQRYRKKGILTVDQLSMLFRPRRRKKKMPPPPIASTRATSARYPHQHDLR
jgi:predicted RecB family nuclease